MTYSRGPRRLLAAFAVVAFFGALAAGLLLARNATRPTKAETTEAFLRNVRDGNFTKAFSRLCPDEQRIEGQDSFVSGLKQARDHGRGLARYEYSFPFDRESISQQVALGTATHADGSTSDLTIGVRGTKGACVTSWHL